MDALAALQHGIAPALASALLHSLWLNALLALAAACALATMARSSAAARHTVAMLFLLAMVLAPVVRFAMFWRLLPGEANAGWLPATMAVEAVGMTQAYMRTSSVVQAVVAALWLLGVALALSHHVWGLRSVRTMKRALHDTLPPAWRARVDRLQRAMGIAREVAVHVSQDVVVPCAARVLRPVVWLPAALLARMPVDQLEALIAHELAHIARRDWLWNGLQCVCEALLFFHPAAWWLGRRIRQEREHACDDLAVAACGDAIALAEALTALERQRRTSPPLVLAANGGLLMQRITRLMSAHSTRGTRIARIALGIVLVGGVFAAAQAAFSGHWRPDLHVYSTTEGELGPGDVREIKANGIDGRRVYRATVDAQGRLVETYKKDGRTRPIDADVRRWLAEIDLLSAPPPPAPPAPPTLPAPPSPPSPPDVKASAEFKALMRLVAANSDVKAKLGTPLTVGNGPVDGNIRLDDGEGDAELSFVLQSPKGKARVHLIADMKAGTWRLDAIDLR